MRLSISVTACWNSVACAVGELELGDRRGLDQRAVGLDDLLLDDAHLRVHQRPVLHEVEALELDRTGTRRRLSFLRTNEAAQPVRKPSGRNVMMPISWPPIDDSTLLMPVG